MHMRKITPLLMVLMFVISSAIAQVRNVTGKVIDASGAPVPYVTITVKGTKSAVAANDNGIFTIKAKTGDVLVVTGVGLQSQEIKVTNDPVLNVSVARVSSNLSEVVVTALGIQKQSKEIGYSTATVASKDLVVAKPISVANGLTGKASGLQVNTTNNGLFAPTRITLRGNRSLTGNNSPLIVVDGAIFYNDISTLNPNDIIDINIPQKSLSVRLTDEQIAERLKTTRAPERHYTGLLARYQKLVHSASSGAYLE